MLLRAYEHGSLRQEIQEGQQRPETTLSSNAEGQCGRMIGTSPEMGKVYELVERVANIQASVLITGESGTGKELIASAIHQLGDAGP